MPYRFIRKISNSVAEVSTPGGRTIRLPYTGSLPKKGGIINPILGNCCCPKKLEFPGTLPTGKHTKSGPRRTSLQKPRFNFILPILYQSRNLEIFRYEPSLPPTYIVFILPPTGADYPASQFPLVGIGLRISNTLSGPKILGLTPAKFPNIVYQLETLSFGTAYDNFGNVTYYGDGSRGGRFWYGVLWDYLYTLTGDVADTGITIEEYVENHKAKYPLSDSFHFAKYYIGDIDRLDIDRIVDWLNNPGYSAKFILDSIHPKTKYFITHSVSGEDFIINHKDLDYTAI